MHKEKQNFVVDRKNLQGAKKFTGYAVQNCPFLDHREKQFQLLPKGLKLDLTSKRVTKEGKIYNS